jgi:hypothetical protein
VVDVLGRAAVLMLVRGVVGRSTAPHGAGGTASDA